MPCLLVTRIHEIEIFIVTRIHEIEIYLGKTSPCPMRHWCITQTGQIVGLCPSTRIFLLVLKLQDSILETDSIFKT